MQWTKNHRVLSARRDRKPQAAGLNQSRTRLVWARARYKFGLVLFGLAILNELKSDKEENQVEVLDTIAKASDGLAAVLLPMIEALGALDLRGVS